MEWGYLCFPPLSLNKMYYLKVTGKVVAFCSSVDNLKNYVQEALPDIRWTKASMKENALKGIKYFSETDDVIIYQFSRNEIILLSDM